MGSRLLRSQTAGDISPVSEPLHTPWTPPPSGLRRKRPSTAIRSKFRIRRKGDPSWCSRFAGRCQDAMKSEEVGNQCIAGLFPGQHRPQSPLPSHLFFAVVVSPQDPGNGLPGEATKTQDMAEVSRSRHRRQMPGHDGGKKARQACCPTSTEGSWGVCETKPPSTTQGRPSARYTIALVALCMIDFERPLDHRSLSRFLLEPSAVTTDD